MPVRTNRMQQKLRQGQPAFGGLLRTPEPTLVEVLGYAGYDYAVLDAEHGAHSFEAPDTLVLTAYASDITPIVRVNENAPDLIMRVLDIGAQGVLVPHIKNADDARRAVDAALYPPDGARHRSEPWLPIRRHCRRRILQADQRRGSSDADDGRGRRRGKHWCHHRCGWDYGAVDRPERSVWLARRAGPGKSSIGAGRR